MFPVWQDIGLFKSTGDRWLSELGIKVIKRRISQEDMGDVNVQGLGNATIHENVEDDDMQQNEGEFDTQDDCGSDNL